jgi:hypothetical protein
MGKIKRVYDPRTNSFEPSNNPALLLYEVLIRSAAFRPQDLEAIFKDRIIELANMCDERGKV